MSCVHKIQGTVEEAGRSEAAPSCEVVLSLDQQKPDCLGELFDETLAVLINIPAFIEVDVLTLVWDFEWEHAYDL